MTIGLVLLVFKATDQRIDWKSKLKRREYFAKERWVVSAICTQRLRIGYRQGALLALSTEPWQFSFTVFTQGH